MNNDNLDIETLDEIDATALENPYWEIRHFDEYGSYVGPKHIGDMIAQLLEEID